MALLPKTLKEIRKVVWKTVNEKDFLYIDQHPKSAIVDKNGGMEYQNSLPSFFR